MAQLNGTKTHQNLKDAFAGESQANRRYLYFAKDGRRRRLSRGSRQSSATPRMVKPATPTAISTT